MAERRRLAISHLGARGDGVAETPDGPVFIPFAAPGDKVEVELAQAKKGPPQATLLRVIEAGDGRATPACRHFGVCGGCSLQHVSADLYRRWCADRVQLALAQHGLEAERCAPPSVSPPGSRRRLALKAQRRGQRVALGFNERSSHRLVDIAECPVAAPALVALFEPLRAVLSGLAGAAWEIRLTVTATGVDMCLDGRGALDLTARESLAAFAEKRDLASLHYGEDGVREPVAIRRPPVMDFDGIAAPLPPGAFVQATEEGEQALRQAVMDWTAGAARVVDLFCGLGTFTLPLARQAQVLAVEGAREMLDALGQGAARAPGLRRVERLHRDLFRRPLTPQELSGFDAVIFDPPRAGAKAQAAALADSDTPRVVAISCNPDTFARDARLLAGGGYRLSELRPVGQFLWSHHLELAALFVR